MKAVKEIYLNRIEKKKSVKYSVDSNDSDRSMDLHDQQTILDQQEKDDTYWGDWASSTNNQEEEDTYWEDWDRETNNQINEGLNQQ